MQAKAENLLKDKTTEMVPDDIEVIAGSKYQSPKTPSFRNSIPFNLFSNFGNRFHTISFKKRDCVVDFEEPNFYHFIKPGKQ